MFIARSLSGKCSGRGWISNQNQLTERSRGGGGIRTHEDFRPAGFQDRSHQPLDHPSVLQAFPFWHPESFEQVFRASGRSGVDKGSCSSEHIE